jgi:hypothetical protein
LPYRKIYHQVKTIFHINFGIHGVFLVIAFAMAMMDCGSSIVARTAAFSLWVRSYFLGVSD